jgi:hypothetical protein
VRISWYDHGGWHQSSAIPDLPKPDDTWGIYGRKAHEHFRTDVVGMNLWRIPLIHRLIADGHEIVAHTRRKVMPCVEKDDDLARLIAQYPEFERFVKLPDPCLDGDTFRSLPIRQAFNVRYVSDKFHFPASDAATSEMLRKWVNEQSLGVPADVDVLVIAAMRADVATAFETSYLIGTYLERGTPVIIWDQDRQLSGTVSAFNRLGHKWPHPLVTVIGPYEEETRYAKPITLDYPYVDIFEREPARVAERDGPRYVGNDYGRRDAMERLLLCHTKDGLPVRVWGEYGKAASWTRQFPGVSWEGRCAPNQVPEIVAKALFAVNIVKDEYVPIGLLTLRTFDTNVYGTLQMGDRRVARLSSYIPDDYLVGTTAEARNLARRIRAYTDSDYRAELERQREMTKRNDMDAFISRFYEILETGMRKGTHTRTDRTPLSKLPKPVMKPLDFWGEIDKQGNMIPSTVYSLRDKPQPILEEGLLSE